MKKLFASILACCLLLCACGTSGTEKTPHKESGFVPVMVADTDTYSIAVTNVLEDSDLGPALEVRFQNKSDNTISFALESAVVCGLDVSSLFTLEVEPGRIERTEIAFLSPELEYITEKLNDISLWFTADNARHSIRFFPYGEENTTLYRRQPRETDTVLLDNEYATVVLMNLDPNGFFGYAAELYYVNKTDKVLRFMLEDCQVNGQPADPFYAESIAPDACAFSNVYWFTEDLEALGITQVSSLQFRLMCFDMEQSLDAPICDQTCTVTAAP